MVDYIRLAATAKRLIDKNGRTVSLTKVDRTTASLPASWRSTGTNDTTVASIKAVIVPFDSEDVDGELIRREDMRAFVSGNDGGVQEIETFDKLLDGTDVWKIQRVRTINPGSTRIVYDIQVRK